MTGDGASPKRRMVGILLFDNVEVLDFSGPFEVFFSARLDGRDDEDSTLFELITIAENDRMVRCNGDLLVRPGYTIDDHPPVDILVVPGGNGPQRKRASRRLVDWIIAQNRRNEITMSVCTGAFLLAECGILDGLEATTHWAYVNFARRSYPDIAILNNVRLVDNGHVMTSAGISAGTDLALHVVERLYGERAAAWTARRMEHLWSEQYRSIFESSADAILILDSEGRIAETNSAACQLFGFGRREMAGLSAVALVSEELRPAVLAHLAQVRQTGSAELRSWGRRKDGTRFHAELRGTSFEYHGVPHVLSMIRDITARVEAEEAVRQERQRLSRDLHDSVSQALYSIALGARTARALADRDPGGVAAPLDFVLEQAERGLAEMRALIFELRPETLEQEGLIAALSRRAAAMRAQYQIELETTFCDEPAAPLDVKEALYRIAQEALQNTVKHAQATKVQVALARDDGLLTLRIQDDGAGFAPGSSFPGHLGLQSMRERAVQLGGSLDLLSAPGAGTSITVRMPLSEVAAAATSADRPP